MVNNFSQRHWLHIIQFFVVFIATINVKSKMPADPGKVGIAIIIFLFLLYAASIYEITIKPSIKKNTSKSKLLGEVMIIWITPLVLGFFMIS